MKGLEDGRDGERGFAATELALGVGVLLLPVALVVLTIPTWSERQTTARVIAREVARAVVALGVCDAGAGRATGAVIAQNLGLAPGDAHVSLDCVSGAVLEPGGDVEAVVTVRMPAVHLAAMGDVGAWSWTARHRQPVDTYVSVP
jgi:hypothetical protein